MAITTAKAMRILLAQAEEQGIVITCGLCPEPVTLDQAQKRRLRWEHMTPKALGGADDETNIRLVHEACAAFKTNGPAHLKVDGDLSRIAKADRIADKKGGLRVAKIDTSLVIGPQRPPSSPWPKGSRKLTSRGFEDPPPGYRSRLRRPASARQARLSRKSKFRTRSVRCDVI